MIIANFAVPIICHWQTDHIVYLSLPLVVFQYLIHNFREYQHTQNIFQEEADIETEKATA